MDNAAHVLFGPSTQCQGELMAVMCHKKPYNEKKQQQQQQKQQTKYKQTITNMYLSLNQQIDSWSSCNLQEKSVCSLAGPKHRSPVTSSGICSIDK